MARSTQKAELERLIRLTEKSRARLTTDIAAFKERINVPARVKDSLRSRPGGWLGGSLLAGLAASLLFKRRKRRPAWEFAERPRKRRRGMLGLLGGLVTLVSPMLMTMARTWAGNQVRHYLATQTLPRFFSRAHPVDSRFSKTP